MNIEDIREYCITKPGVSECFPFDETTLVFKVMGKIFCMINLDGEPGLLLKNTPENIIEMRERFSYILPGYHMNKTYWNLVMIDHSDSAGQILSWIDESYNEVVAGLPGKIKYELKIKQS
jgi:predicted DNA-binding protein (MmcQ/YjbR family)